MITLLRIILMAALASALIFKPLYADSDNSSNETNSLEDRVKADESKLTEAYAAIRGRLNEAQKAVLKQDELKWIREKDAIPVNDPQHAEAIEQRIAYLQSYGSTVPDQAPAQPAPQPPPQPDQPLRPPDQSSGPLTSPAPPGQPPVQPAPQSADQPTAISKASAAAILQDVHKSSDLLDSNPEGWLGLVEMFDLSSNNSGSAPPVQVGPRVNITISNNTGNWDVTFALAEEGTKGTEFKLNNGYHSGYNIPVGLASRATVMVHQPDGSTITYSVNDDGQYSLRSKDNQIILTNTQ